MTLVEVKKALLELMQTIFPKERYTYYAASVVENYKRPSFFTSLTPVNMEPCNLNTRNNIFTFHITYMQERVNEEEALLFVEKIRDLFGLCVIVGKRGIDVTEFQYDFIGSDGNIPQISITLEWMESIFRDNDAPVMEQAELKLEKMEE